MGDRYIGGTEALRILGVDSGHLKRLVQRGLIGIRRYPGSDPRYRLDDLEALVQKYTVPARAQVPEPLTAA